MIFLLFLAFLSRSEENKNASITAKNDNDTKILPVSKTNDLENENDLDNDEDEDYGLHNQALAILEQQRKLQEEYKKENQNFTKNETKPEPTKQPFIKKHIKIPIENKTIIEENVDQAEDEEIIETPQNQTTMQNQLIINTQDDDEEEIPVRRKNANKKVIKEKKNTAKKAEESKQKQNGLRGKQKNTKKETEKENVVEEELMFYEQDIEPVNDIISNDDFGTCDGQHTIRTRSGSCVCEESFVYGDPTTEIGCWKCDIACHVNASCDHNGQCLCMPGLFGDGVTKCLPIKPIAKSASPLHGTDIGGTLIVVALEEQQKTAQSQILCRFGKQMYEGQVFNATTVACISPSGKADKSVPFSVSFNGKEWSKTFYFAYTSRQRTIKKEIIRGALLTIATTCYAVIRRILTMPSDDDEYKPFLFLD